MLDEERVILMTKMAAYNARNGRKNDAMNAYFRGDYVGFNVLKSIISATICYCIIVAAYLIYDFEDVIQNLYNTDLLATGKQFLLYYIIMIVAYAVLSYIVYSYRYSKMRKELKGYYNNLRKLSKMYEKE